MEDKYFRRKKMFLGVCGFLEKEGMDIALTAPIILGSKTRILACMAAIQENETIASQDNTGTKDQKELYKMALCEVILDLSGALRALYLLKKDKVNAKKVHITLSRFKKTPVTGVFDIYDTLMTHAAANADDLIAISMDEDFLLGVTAAFNTYNAYKNEPRDQKTICAEARKKIEELYVTMYDELDILDGIIQSASGKHKEASRTYRDRRKMIDASRTRRPADFKLSIGPGKYLVVLSIAYLQGRYFRLKNMGRYGLMWGLSTVQTGFSSKSFPIEAGSKSTRKSKTLGPEGEFLVVYNPSEHKVEFEVWQDF